MSYASQSNAQVYDVSIPLPADVNVRDVVLGATNNLRVETFSSVQAGKHSTIVNTGNGPLSTTGISVGAATGTVMSAATTTIELATINGDIVGEGRVVRVPGSTVTGSVRQNTPFGRGTSPRLRIEFPGSSGGSIDVPPLATRSLSPGRYTKLEVSPGATVQLRSGVYYFDVFVVDPLSTVIVDESAGPVEIYVRTTVQHMGTYRPASGTTPPNLLVVFLGIVPAYIGAGFPGP